VEPTIIPQGASATLTWDSTDADIAIIDNGIGEVGLSDSMLVSPGETTTYTITATNMAGTITAAVILTVVQPPTVAISIEPTLIPQGGSATMIWDTTAADTVTIDHGIGEVDANGSISISPAQTTTYTITATNITGRAMATATVTVVPPPTLTINIDPSEILVGENATLTWTSTNVDKVTIDHGIGDLPANGSMSVSPEETTTYTLTATNIAGTASDSVTISVIRSPKVTISAVPLTIALGGYSTLSWISSNADRVSIDNGIGDVSESGSIEVSPTQTTTYTITAVNPVETATDSVTVNVIQPPIVSISVDPVIISTGETAILSWNSSNADIIKIDDEIGDVSESGSIEVSPIQTRTYTITAENQAGSITDAVTLKVLSVTPPPEGSFGKQYQELIPDDATIEAYDEKRFCVITGFVY